MVADATIEESRYATQSFSLSTFELKRRSNPRAAFAELYDRYRTEVRKGGELARAAKLFKGGVALTEEDARRLADLKERGISASDFRVGRGFWDEVGPGLALMYDAALESLRSSDQLFKADHAAHRSPRVLARTIESVMPLIGSASVTALETALNDRAFADHLSSRAAEVGETLTPFLDEPPGPCEFCEIVKDRYPEPPERRCGSEQECYDAFGFLLLVILITIVPALIAWIISWFD